MAARRRIHSLEELIEESPADGLIMGLATINGAPFPEQESRAMIVPHRVV